MSNLRSRTSTENGRIIIAGTGRTGTTFLVQLFTALGFNTGYSLQEAVETVDEISHAGLERPILSDDNPYVIKSPWFADQLSDVLEKQTIKIYMALIPIRRLFEAAESRRRVHFEAASRGSDSATQLGGLWYTTDPEAQESILATQLYHTIYPLVKFDVRMVFLEFPRLVFDKFYLFEKLLLLLAHHGVTYSEFATGHARVARPEIIHKFSRK
jgi:hypothetical protein